MADRIMRFKDAKRGIQELNASMATVAARGLDRHDDEGYHSSEEESEVEEATARKSLGEAGSVTLADSIWQKCVPPDLLKTYKHLRTVPPMKKRKEKNLEHMLEQCEDNNKRSEAHQEKGHKILLSTAQDEREMQITAAPKRDPQCRQQKTTKIQADPPRGFWGVDGKPTTKKEKVLPGEDRPHQLLLVHPPPRKWRQVFIVKAGRRSYRITRLPFGWKYSPAICQRLVDRMVQATLRRRRWAGGMRRQSGRAALGWTYRDDVLVSHGRRGTLKRVMRGLATKFVKAGFMISPKSVLAPQRRLDFVGKHLEPQRCEISNNGGSGSSVMAGSAGKA